MSKATRRVKKCGETEQANTAEVWDASEAIMAECKPSLEDMAMRLRVYTQGAVRRAIAAERERCCRIVFEQCDNDNVAQRTVDAIRKGEA